MGVVVSSVETPVSKSNGEDWAYVALRAELSTASAAPTPALIVGSHKIQDIEAALLKRGKGGRETGANHTPTIEETNGSNPTPSDEVSDGTELLLTTAVAAYRSLNVSFFKNIFLPRQVYCHTLDIYYLLPASTSPTARGCIP